MSSWLPHPGGGGGGGSAIKSLLGVGCVNMGFQNRPILKEVDHGKIVTAHNEWTIVIILILNE